MASPGMAEWGAFQPLFCENFSASLSHIDKNRDRYAAPHFWLRDYYKDASRLVNDGGARRGGSIPMEYGIIESGKCHYYLKGTDE